MSRRSIVIGLLVVAVVAVAAVLYLLRPLEDPSEDVQENTEQLSAESDEAIVFRISQEESQVEFNIDEVLRGQDNTVVGISNEVAGDILVNLADPATSEVGQIRINARTFATDSSRRDSAIGRFILQAERDEFEFIEFQPTEVTGLPESVAVGDTVEFQVTGDLTIKGTTNSVVFDASVTLDSEEQITGHAETTVTYPDFGLSIPSVPSVTSVEDDVILKIDFVANRVAEDDTAAEG